MGLPIYGKELGQVRGVLVAGGNRPAPRVIATGPRRGSICRLREMGTLFRQLGWIPGRPTTAGLGVLQDMQDVRTLPERPYNTKRLVLR